MIYHPRVVLLVFYFFESLSITLGQQVIFRILNEYVAILLTDTDFVEVLMGLLVQQILRIHIQKCLSFTQI